MLDLDICEKCCDRGRGNEIDRKWVTDRGFVRCPFEVASSMLRNAYIDKPPPKHCPYAFEHAVAESVNIDKK